MSFAGGDTGGAGEEEEVMASTTAALTLGLLLVDVVGEALGDTGGEIALSVAGVVSRACDCIGAAVVSTDSIISCLDSLSSVTIGKDGVRFG